MKHKKDDIILAIECHNEGLCHKCPYEGLPDCIGVLCDSTLEFIKEITEENERLRADCVKGAGDLIEEMLRSRAIKADTVRKMQERLKAQAIIIKDHTGKMGTVVGVGNIDDVAREMLDER